MADIPITGLEAFLKHLFMVDRKEARKFVASNMRMACECDSQGRTLLHIIAENEGFCKLADGDAPVPASLHVASRASKKSIRKHDLTGSAGMDHAEGGDVQLTRLLELCLTLLETPNFPVNKRDFQGRTALIAAATKGNYVILKHLLSHTDIDTNIYDNRGQSSLSYLLRLSGETPSDKVLERDMLSGLSQEEVDSRRQQALFEAIDALLSRDVSVGCVDVQGSPALHAAAVVQGNAAVITHLVKRGACTLQKDKCGNLALHCAAKAGILENVTALSASSALSKYVSRVDEKSSPLPFDLLPKEISSNEDTLSPYAEQLLDVFLPVHTYCAVRDHDIDSLEGLLMDSYLKNEFRYRNKIPTDLAVDLLKTITEAEYIVYVRNLCFLLALAFRDSELIYWIANNFEVDPEKFSTRDGINAVMVLSCVTTSHPVLDEIFNLLLSNPIVIQSKTVQEETLQHITAMSGNTKALQRIVDDGGTINATTRAGDTPLHYAIMANHPETVEYLLDVGADPEICSLHFGTSMKLAKALRSKEIFEMVSRSCALDESNSEFNTAVLDFKSVNGITVRDSETLGQVYVSCTHQLYRKRKRDVTTLSVCRQGNASWSDSVMHFPMFSGTVSQRDVLLEVYVTVDEGVTARCIGRANLELQMSSEKVTAEVDVITAKGRQGSVSIEISFTRVDDSSYRILLKQYAGVREKDDPWKELKKATGEKKVGAAYRSLGYRPRHPVLIVPGIFGCRMHIHKSTKKDWINSTLVLSASKVSSSASTAKKKSKEAAHHDSPCSNRASTYTPTQSSNSSGSSSTGSPAYKASSMLPSLSGSFSISGPSGTDTSSSGSGIGKAGSTQAAEKKRARLLEHLHLLIEEHVVRDPEGICVRPVPDITGLEEVSQPRSSRQKEEEPLVSGMNLCGTLIKLLKQIGYGPENLKGFPYDWRLDMRTMEERDGLFTLMKAHTEMAVRNQRERAVLVAHGLGVRVTQYFLKWVEHKATDGGLAWIDKHIHGLVAVAAPWAGIPLADRALYSGCSTDVVDYLTGQHDLEKLQVVGVHPAIFSLTPVGARYYPDAVYRMCNEEGQYEAVDPVTVMEKNCPDAVNVFERFHKEDRFTYNSLSRNSSSVPLLEPPYVRHLWNIYGINNPTELVYYFKEVTLRKEPLEETKIKKKKSFSMTNSTTSPKRSGSSKGSRFMKSPRKESKSPKKSETAPADAKQGGDERPARKGSKIFGIGKADRHVREKEREKEMERLRIAKDKAEKEEQSKSQDPGTATREEKGKGKMKDCMQSPRGPSIPAQRALLASEEGDGASKYVLDPAADEHSNNKSYANPKGLHISYGIGVETCTTQQTIGKNCKSGDGTVPYCSLALPRLWCLAPPANPAQESEVGAESSGSPAGSPRSRSRSRSGSGSDRRGSGGSEKLLLRNEMSILSLEVEGVNHRSIWNNSTTLSYIIDAVTHNAAHPVSDLVVPATGSEGAASSKKNKKLRRSLSPKFISRLRMGSNPPVREGEKNKPVAAADVMTRIRDTVREREDERNITPPEERPGPVPFGYAGGRRNNTFSAGSSPPRMDASSSLSVPADITACSASPLSSPSLSPTDDEDSSPKRRGTFAAR